MLSAIVLLPLLGAIVIASFLRDHKQVRLAALGVALADFVLTLVLFGLFNQGNADPQFVERLRWLPSLGVQYYLGVDGLNLPMIVLTGLLGVVAVLASWHVENRAREYFAWLLVLQTSVMGVFASLDLLLFFLFWELELVPMYLLIAAWGSAPPVGRREYSAMKFVIFTFVGSAFMLVGILALYFSTGTFDMIELARMPAIRPVLFTLPAIFWLIFAGFAVKLPMVPVHTWLPDAHTDAPTAVSVILAGVLLKMGGYGMIRVAISIFPGVAREFAWVLALLAVVAVLYGAVITLRQRDLKRLIAYSSVSHMGYVLLGIAALSPVGLSGAVLQMFTHGTITGLLFALVGLVYDKAHTRQIPELGGLAARMPFIAVAMAIAGLASLGLPGLSGFAAEFLVFSGSFSSPLLSGAQLYAILGIIGIVITAGYILWMMERTFFGPQREHLSHVPDATFVEGVPVAALIVAIVVIGVYPAVLTNIIEAGVAPIVTRLAG